MLSSIREALSKYFNRKKYIREHKRNATNKQLSIEKGQAN